MHSGPAQGRERWVINKLRALNSWYTKGLDDGSHLRIAMNSATSIGELRDLIHTFFMSDRPPRVADLRGTRRGRRAVTPRVRGLLMAALCGLVLFARVYAEFPSIRWKIDHRQGTRPSERGSLAIDIPYVEILADNRPRRSSSSRGSKIRRANDVTINVSWNATNIAPTAVGAGQTASASISRCLTGQTLRGEDRVALSRRRDGPWQVTYLELANLHGSARGLVNAMFVPAR